MHKASTEDRSHSNFSIIFWIKKKSPPRNLKNFEVPCYIENRSLTVLIYKWDGSTSLKKLCLNYKYSRFLQLWIGDHNIIAELLCYFSATRGWSIVLSNRLHYKSWISHHVRLLPPTVKSQWKFTKPQRGKLSYCLHYTNVSLGSHTMLDFYHPLSNHSENSQNHRGVSYLTPC